MPDSKAYESFFKEIRTKQYQFSCNTTHYQERVFIHNDYSIAHNGTVWLLTPAERKLIRDDWVAFQLKPLSQVAKVFLKSLFRAASKQSTLFYQGSPKEIKGNIIFDLSYLEKLKLTLIKMQHIKHKNTKAMKGSTNAASNQRDPCTCGFYSSPKNP